MIRQMMANGDACGKNRLNREAEVGEEEGEKR